MLIDKKILLCKLCDAAVVHDQKSHVAQHLKTLLRVKIEKIFRSNVQHSLEFSIFNRAERWYGAFAKAGVPFANFEYLQFTEILESEIEF